MTEADWLTCNDPEPMLHFLCQKQVSERKMRLLACACCRRVWDQLTDPRSRQAVEVAERFADRQASMRDLTQARLHAWRAASGPAMAAVWTASAKPSGPIWNVFAAASALLREDVQSGAADWDAALAVKTRRQVRLVHEVMGNPFRPRALERDCLAWGRGVVRHLAEGIYEEQAFERMGILGDALEDAGCRDEVILEHCRQGGEHVRGCWVLDLLTDRE
jgi:hypothetical protein